MEVISPRISFFPRIASFDSIESTEMDRPWNERAISRIDDFEAWIERKRPNFEFQKRADALGRQIEAKFSKLKGFNEWLDSNGEGNWIKKFAIFLAKLPARSVRNIIRLVYGIIKCALYTAVHPVKAAAKLAKLLVRLAHELTKPETWTKIGAGMIGGSLGQFVITGNPFALIGVGIGGAMILGGMASGAVIAALKNEDGKMDAVKAELWKQCKVIPETMLTGFVIGLIFGSISETIQRHEVQAIFNGSDVNKINDWVNNQFLPPHNLPGASHVHADDSGAIAINWDGREFKDLTMQSNQASNLLTGKINIDVSSGLKIGEAHASLTFNLEGNSHDFTLLEIGQDAALSTLEAFYTNIRTIAAGLDLR